MPDGKRLILFIFDQLLQQFLHIVESKKAGGASWLMNEAARSRRRLGIR